MRSRWRHRGIKPWQVQRLNLRQGFPVGCVEPWRASRFVMDAISWRQYELLLEATDEPQHILTTFDRGRSRNHVAWHFPTADYVDVSHASH